MRVIINADDFGYSSDTVEATLACIEAGLLTSATIMPSAPSTAAALEYAAKRPSGISFGVHLTFVGDGIEYCVAPRRDVPVLTESDGRLRRARTTRLRAIAHLMPVDQVARELAAQVTAVRSAGVDVSHVDSHKHVHKLPVFQTALRRTLPELAIDRVRNVQDVWLARPKANLTSWLGGRWGRALERTFTTTDHFYMPSTAHDRDWDRVAERLDELGGETLEVGIHPGTAEEWRRLEQEPLRRFVDALHSRGHELISWSEIDRVRA
jgi:predicted glycoside hydrolase/deacetylase ChbG (UPF0249 family)